MIRAIVVDDEPIAREGMAALVGATSGFTVSATCASGEEALQAMRELSPDVVLLDVQMPDMSGLDVVRRGGTTVPYVIFVTAYDQFAIDAFELHALDYVLKPFTDDRLRAALARTRIAVRDRKFGSLGERYSALLDEFGPPSSLPQQPSRLAVHGTGVTRYVAVDDIEWIESDSNYVQLHCGGKPVLMREPLQSLAARLDARFLRVHRSAIVRVDRVRELRRDRLGEVVAILKSGASVTVSRTRLATLEARLTG